jgi:F0F1-type ATP synthase delta subunit
MRIVDTQLARAVLELNAEGRLSGGDLALALSRFLRRHHLERRAGKISRTLEAYAEFISGIRSATVTTAHPLDDAGQEQMSRMAARLLGKPGSIINPTFREDPKLIGGFRIETDDTCYDSSVARGLKELHKSLL